MRCQGRHRGTDNADRTQTETRNTDGNAQHRPDADENGLPFCFRRTDARSFVRVTIRAGPDKNGCCTTTCPKTRGSATRTGPGQKQFSNTGGRHARSPCRVQDTRTGRNACVPQSSPDATRPIRYVYPGDTERESALPFRMGQRCSASEACCALRPQKAGEVVNAPGSDRDPG
jgi:hypothetical protein